MKIVINTCFGGFSLSEAALECLEVPKTYSEFDRRMIRYQPDIDRADPKLIGVVEELGPAANGACADLKIVEIPDDVQWTIQDYDGNEWIAEAHRTWN